MEVCVTHKERVKEFFKVAKENGYDRVKIRRIIEHKLRELANSDTDMFDNAAYAVIKSLGIKLKKRSNNDHL
jgi:uncharacterized protein (UPF0335 family)